MPETGVIITGFGGPDCLEAVGPFMCNLMGREPSPELLERVRARYRTIGGASPLPGIAAELASGVRSALADAGHDVAVRVGMRYTDPTIADAVSALAEDGVSRIVLVTLSPFETRVTHGEYRAALEDALAGYPAITAFEAPLFSEMPSFASIHAAAARESLGSLPEGSTVIFSAHSLPVPDALADGSYVAGLRAAADAIASSLGLPAGSDSEVLPGVVAYGSGEGDRAWVLAYQSKGARGGEWLGPDTDDVIDAAAGAGARGVLVVPVGFATDHLETLYDLDIVAAGRAADAGVAFARSAVPNAAPGLVHDIAASVMVTLGAV